MDFKEMVSPSIGRISAKFWEKIGFIARWKFATIKNLGKGGLQLQYTTE
jgi:hypothetical protein